MSTDSDIKLRYMETIFETTDKAGFGKKTIGNIGSFCLISNSVIGPAILLTPVLFQSSGWLFTTILFLIVCVISCLTATFFIETMCNFKNNENFQGRVEFT